MIYSFRSLTKKNVDVGEVIRFRNFMFQTSDEELAAVARRNCVANPSEYQEITGGDFTPPTMGVKTVSGVRTSEVQEIAREAQNPPPLSPKKPGRPKKQAQPTEGVKV